MALTHGEYSMVSSRESRRVSSKTLLISHAVTVQGGPVANAILQRKMSIDLCTRGLPPGWLALQLGQKVSCSSAAFERMLDTISDGNNDIAATLL
eukprot:6177076-Pleurochrysis_carterae.AAC.2